MQHEPHVLEHYSVAIEGGRIAAVLPSEDARRTLIAANNIERPQHLLMPGLVNSHVLLPNVMLRGLSATNALSVSASADPEFARVAMELAIIDSLRAGVTTVAALSDAPDVIASLASTSHMRVSVGLPIADRETLWAGNSHECLTKGLALRDEYREDPWVTTHFVIPDGTELTRATLERIQRNADELELPVSVALDPRYCGIELLMQNRLLSPLLLIRSAHELPRECIAALTGANANLIWPDGHVLAQLQDSAVNLAAGSYGSWHNAELDLMGLLRHALRESTPALLAAGLRSCTLGGAQALGLSEHVGSIETGKWADLVCVDLRRANTQPTIDPLRQFVLQGSRDAITDVWVGGVAALSDGALTRLDEERIFAAANKQLTAFRNTR